MSNPYSLEAVIAEIRGDVKMARDVIEIEQNDGGVISRHKVGECVTAAIETVLGNEKKLAATLRYYFGNKVNPCLAPEDSVRLRTDAARINHTADRLERILQEFGL